MTMKKVLIGLFIVAAFCGCLKNETNSFSCNYDECGTVAPSTEIDSLKKYLATHAIVATQHCSGAFFSVDDEGSGAAPSACSNIAFTYEGRLLNGNVFDSSLTNPVVGPVSSLITGVKLGALKIRTGGRIHMYIPPSLGYGSTANPKVPANSYLVFDMKILAVQ